MPEGKALTLAGGEISVEGGHLVAPNGLVNLVSAKSAGEVAIDPGAKLLLSQKTGLVTVPIVKPFGEAADELIATDRFVLVFVQRIDHGITHLKEPHICPT